MAEQSGGDGGTGGGKEGDGGTGSGAAALGAAAAATPATPPAWTEGMTPEQTGLVENKGWDGPGAALDSYAELSKMIGKDTIQFPGEGDTEAMSKLLSRLGRPDTADGYKLEVPDGANPDFAKAFAGVAHEAGLTQAQVAKTMEWYNGQAATSATAAAEAKTAAGEQALTGLKAEWGAAYEQNVEQGRRAATEFGVDIETLGKIEGALGTADMLKLFADIGAKLGEDTVSGDGGGSSLSLSPAAALQQISELNMDPNFVSALNDKSNPGHKDAVAKKTRLFQFAYPEKT